MGGSGAGLSIKGGELNALRSRNRVSLLRLIEQHRSDHPYVYYFSILGEAFHFVRLSHLGSSKGLNFPDRFIPLIFRDHLSDVHL